MLWGLTRIASMMTEFLYIFIFHTCDVDFLCSYLWCLLWCCLWCWLFYVHTCDADLLCSYLDAACDADLFFLHVHTCNPDIFHIQTSDAAMLWAYLWCCLWCWLLMFIPVMLPVMLTCLCSYPWSDFFNVHTYPMMLPVMLTFLMFISVMLTFYDHNCDAECDAFYDHNCDADCFWIYIHICDICLVLTLCSYLWYWLYRMTCTRHYCS